MASTVAASVKSLVKASVYIATSLDGFIAREDGDLDWLEGAGEGSSDTDYGYQEFMDSVDVLLIGRGTFEKVLSFGGWAYGDKWVVVLSNSLTELPPHLPDSVELLALEPRELVAHLASRGARHLYVDGGVTIQRFLNAGLLDELIITRIPVLIGSGIPLFGPVEQDVSLKHLETQAFPNGFVQSRYQVLQ